MTELEGQLGIGVGANPVHDLLEGRALGVVPQSGASWGNATVRAGSGHFDEHHGSSAQRTRAQMHQVIVARHAIDRRVLRHR